MCQPKDHVSSEAMNLAVMNSILTLHREACDVSGFIAQLVRASHWYREVTGSNPVEVLNFFRLLYTIAKIAFITARIIASLDFISAVQ